MGRGEVSKKRKDGCIILGSHFMWRMQQFWDDNPHIGTKSNHWFIPLINKEIAKSIVSVCKSTSTLDVDIPADRRWYVNRAKSNVGYEDFWHAYINAVLIDTQFGTCKFEISLKKQFVGEPPARKFTIVSETLETRIDMVLGEIRGHGVSDDTIKTLSIYTINRCMSVKSLIAMYTNTGLELRKPSWFSSSSVSPDITDALEVIRKKCLNKVLAPDQRS